MFNFTTETEHDGDVASFDLQLDANTENFNSETITEAFGGGGVLNGAFNAFYKVEKIF